MSCNWFPTKVYCFHDCLLTQFWLFALNISVCTNTEHQGNRYPAARNSASPPETFMQQLNTPGTVTILQGVLGGWNGRRRYNFAMTCGFESEIIDALKSYGQLLSEW